ncbi:MAG: hypothetical protein JXQ27_06105 [Acidobacteria bacterium]|nr:hypothetical protein [Acidobacteriota bacterium]
MNSRTTTLLISLCLLLAGPVSWSAAQERGIDHTLGKSAISIVPDTFLRGYDPITIFFPDDRGPAGGGPLDQPGDLFRLSPAHPGEYRWVDARTLQFLPTTPWPALDRFTVVTAGARITLVTFMHPPRQVQPAPGSEGLDPIRDVNLSFADPVDTERLARMVTFQVQPLPGAGEGEGYWLTDRDFVVKPLERPSLDEPAQYQITFRQAIPHGKVCRLHLRLSLDDRIRGALVRYTFKTKPVFRLTGIGCGAAVYPVAVRGSVYSREQALDCGTGREPIFLQFSDNLGPVSLEQLKRLIHFLPAVDDFRFEANGDRLLLHFAARRDDVYRLRLESAGLRNLEGREMQPPGETSLYFFYRQAEPYLRWLGSQGIVERYGPQMFPMEGRGEEQLDLRLHKIDPLSRNFWPFPLEPVMVDESERPPGPGEEPAYATAMAEQIRLLGSPLVSRLEPLPMRTEQGQITFGLNLKAHLAAISGADRPGHYLVGYRSIGTDTYRHFVRIQVTDLSLSTVEEESAVTFVVTSLQTGQPVSGAEIRIDGERNNQWETVITGTTDAAGRYRYRHTQRIRHRLVRIAVRKGDDVLVLDPDEPPPHFMDNHWYGSYSTWLSWLNLEPENSKEAAVRKAHIFTERPVYRPEEPVHIKGYVRQRRQGKILSPDPDRPRSVIVEGPGGLRFTYPVTLTAAGSFYVKFDEADLPTGTFFAAIRDETEGYDLAQVDFRKEAYRIPRFEVHIAGPDRTPLDQPFTLTLTADYYAGGRVVGQEINWQVTQFPYRHQIPDYPGFIFSSDERFSEGRSFQSTGSIDVMDVTDENGSARLEIDPTAEEDARPRRYVAEATVRGADEQTVTATRSVLALPPFVLGLKLPRLLKDTTTISPEVLVVGPDDKPLAGKGFHVRLLQRQWHSYLRESDFTTGKAKYVTDVVDEIIAESDHVSGDGPQAIPLPVAESGVYVVEISARDRLGRLQKVFADLYMAGETPIAWEKPKANVFETSLDQKDYVPGDTATLILKSPFQEARALVVVEGPAANEYHWLDVTGGQGLFTLPITGDMTPQVPVHVLLMRGRLPGTTGALARGKEDRGKPQAMASTTWITVKPRDNRLDVRLEHPEKCQPGATITMTVRLASPEGQPLDGEVTLWLVDRAVLALGKEKPLDPVPSFIDPVQSMLRFRETRNQVVGNLSVDEIAGGDGAEAEEAGLFGRVTVRRQFESVPYYNPAVTVTGGVAEVTIKLPDNLTEFAVRAVATNGRGRFGAAKSMLAVRLPLIVQSALPRFVRPGDTFLAGGIGRVVEGEGGPGCAELQVEGLTVTGDRSRSLTWVKDQPERIFFPLSVPAEAATGDDNRVVVRLAVERQSDGASDAFEVTLPVQEDKRRRHLETFVTLAPAEEARFPAPREEPRPGTVQQSALVTGQPALLRMLAALDYLARYEHGCTEQRVSQMFPELALKDIFDRIGRPQRLEASRRQMEETFAYLEKTQHDSGLFSAWPGSNTYVSLTAYVVEFLLEAEAQGYRFKPELLSRGIDALKESLRSDYSGFIDGFSFVERAEALAALARAGEFDEAYAQDLLARATSMDLYSEAQIMSAFQEEGPAFAREISRLREDLIRSMVFKLRDGREVYEGLQYRAESWGGLILASETKTLASVTRALHRSEPENPRVGLLVTELISLGAGDGWGDTNANAAALRALAMVLGVPAPPGQGARLRFSFGPDSQQMDTSGQVVSRFSTTSPAPGRVTLTESGAAEPPLAWLRVDYVPAGTGDQVRQANEGFVVEREMLVHGAAGQPPDKILAQAGRETELTMGTLVEEHIRVVNAADRHYVAIQAPLAAGFEPLNPNLATAPPEARPSGAPTLQPSYAQYLDDRVTFYFDTLPKGTYDFYFRVRASIAGSFTQPPARAEMMYKQSVYGHSDGTRVRIQPREE